jgi:uridylate kinase
MDHEAVAKCQQYDLPILVFNFKKPDHIERAVRGERVGTLVSRGNG